jgi:hypothetical protein
MPVYKLEQEMPHTEFLKWIEFFARRPVGWRDDHRASLLMNAQGVKEKGHQIFGSLKVINDRVEAQKAKGNALPSGKFLEMMQKARGGDGSGWEMLRKD